MAFFLFYVDTLILSRQLLSGRSYFIQLGKNAVEYQRDINILACQEWQI